MLKRLLAGLTRDTTPAPAEPSADVLLVDDDPSLRALLKVSLEGQDYRVTTAANGREGVETAGGGRTDLIILDGNMPEMDGFEALKRLRRDRRTARTPVIMLTMRVREGDVLAGCDRRAMNLASETVGGTSRARPGAPCPASVLSGAGGRSGASPLTASTLVRSPATSRPASRPSRRPRPRGRCG